MHIVTTRRVTQADMLDVAAMRVIMPDGTPGPSFTKQEVLTFLDLLTRDPGVVVRYAVIAEALWSVEDDMMAVRAAITKRAQRARALFISAGWTWETVQAASGVGWKIDSDEAARVMQEARGHE